MENEMKLGFNFATKNFKTIKKYMEFLREVHATGNSLIDVHFKKNTVAEIKFYVSLVENIHFTLVKAENTLFGSFFQSFSFRGNESVGRILINNDVADSFFSLPTEAFLVRPLRSKYAKLIYNKVNEKEGADGFIVVSRDTITNSWKIDTNAKMSQFLLRLPLYVNEINSSGFLKKELKYSVNRGSEKSRSRMIAVSFYFVEAKTKNKNAVKSPESNEKETSSNEMPTYTKENKTTLLCPFCGGKIVTCNKLDGTMFECCENSKYNTNRPISERGNCNKYFKKLEC